jgi:hypothetical protein
MENKQEETKAEAFRRLGTIRTENVLDRIRVLAHLADPHRYDYTEEQIAVIEKHLTNAITEMMKKFRGEHKEEQRFVL